MLPLVQVASFPETTVPEDSSTGLTLEFFPVLTIFKAFDGNKSIFSPVLDFILLLSSFLLKVPVYSSHPIRLCCILGISDTNKRVFSYNRFVGLPLYCACVFWVTAALLVFEN